MMRFWRRPSVAVTELARMETCEQQLLLEKQYGKLMTSDQRQRAAIGARGHERQDGAVRYYSSVHAWWAAMRSAVMVGTPLTLFGLLFTEVLYRPTIEGGLSALYRTAEVLVFPGLWWVNHQGSWNDGAMALSAMLGFVAFQFLFYLVVSYIVQSAFAPRRRAPA